MIHLKIIGNFVFWKTCLLSKILNAYHGVVIIVVGKGHGDTSSNPGRDWLHFT